MEMREEERERIEPAKATTDKAVSIQGFCPFESVNPSRNEWKCTHCSAANIFAESIERAKSRYNTGIERIYAIACLFPVLQFKGVEDGRIPGIKPYEFYGKKLADFLSHGTGWSSGEIRVVEFLLSLYDPNIYEKFNFGKALNIWDCGQISAFLTAVQLIEYGG